IIITMLHLPRELVLLEINRYLVEIDRQILRKVCTLFSSLFPHKDIRFNHTDLELVHIRRYQKLWTVNTTKQIVRQGDLEILKYLRSPDSEKPCPWDESTAAWAAHEGHLECLKYLHENGCPWEISIPA